MQSSPRWCRCGSGSTHLAFMAPVSIQTTHTSGGSDQAYNHRHKPCGDDMADKLCALTATNSFGVSGAVREAQDGAAEGAAVTLQHTAPGLQPALVTGAALFGVASGGRQVVRPSNLQIPAHPCPGGRRVASRSMKHHGTPPPDALLPLERSRIKSTCYKVLQVNGRFANRDRKFGRSSFNVRLHRLHGDQAHRRIRHYSLSQRSYQTCPRMLGGQSPPASLANQHSNLLLWRKRAHDAHDHAAPASA